MISSASEGDPPLPEQASGPAERAARRDPPAAQPDPWRVGFDLFILAAVIVYLVTAPQYPGVEHLFPEAVGYPTGALALAAVSRSLISALRARAAGRRAGVERQRDPGRFKPFLGFALIVAYAALLPLLGFRIATLLALTGGPLLMGVRPQRLWIVAIVAVVFTFAVVWLFSSNVGIVLPRGLWG